MTSIQTGFEPWVGGTGLAVNSFTADVNGGGAAQRNRPEQPPAPAPTSAAATPVTPATPSAPVTPTRQPAPQPSPTRGDGHTYVVQPGDTLSGIAAREHVTGGWRRLYWLNRHVVGADPDLIVPGQRLTLR
ncbi:LysM peptidoglycan-binding domain-containing protein [Planosporangium mesophilum]|nr:LysM peptidoglycan-binding domain-containing protein [Planosporangium mesophilum]